MQSKELSRDLGLHVAGWQLLGRVVVRAWDVLRTAQDHRFKPTGEEMGTDLLTSNIMTSNAEFGPQALISKYMETMCLLTLRFLCLVKKWRSGWNFVSR